MIARISTVIGTNEGRMWDELQKVSSLRHVASPILKFRPQTGSILPEKWIAGMEYKLRISSFDVIPLGNHFIRVMEIDNEKKRIVTNEHGLLTRIWNHTITVDAIDDQTIRYADEIEIKAGIFTWFVWLFAHIFYRHRQGKWKKLLAG